MSLVRVPGQYFDVPAGTQEAAEGVCVFLPDRICLVPSRAPASYERVDQPSIDRMRGLKEISALIGRHSDDFRRLILPLNAFAAAFLSLTALAGASAQDSDRAVALNTERAGNVARIAAIDEQAAPTANELRHVLKAIDDHNGRKPNQADRVAVNAFNEEADRPNSKKMTLAATLQALKTEQDQLIARNKEIDIVLDAVRSRITQEQDEFDQMNAAWLRTQERLIRVAVQHDSKWREAVSAALYANVPPDPTARPKTIADVLPGDILLLEPEGWSIVIPPLDRFYRAVEDFARGRIFAAIGHQTEPVSHAIAVVKHVKGTALFLDHTHVGSRILGQNELERLYRNRKIYVARPQTVVDGRQLWELARTAALKHKSDYGVAPGKFVCSERSGIAVAKATGLDLQARKLGPIDITPGDFFDSQSIGKYFIVSPLNSGR